MNISTIFLCIFFVAVNAKTYFFKVNQTSNEFKVYSSVHINNTRLVPPQVGELRNNVSKLKNATTVPFYAQVPNLGLQWNHNKTTNKSVPQYILNLYRTAAGPISIHFNAMPQNSTSLSFNLTKSSPVEVELHFYHTVEKKLFQKPIILRLYQIEEDEYLNETSLINPDAQKLLNVIYISQADSGWQSFKLTAAIADWLKNGTKLKLIITISRPNEQQFTLFRDADDNIRRTFLILKYPDIPVGRNDTSALRDQSQGGCHKQEMTVDLGKYYPFIITPTKYNAYMCSGSCHKGENHENYVKITGPIKRALCCVASSFAPLKVMYYDAQGDIAIVFLENMVVAGCACR